MFRNKIEFSEKYFPILERLFGFEKRVRILPVNFEKPWYQIVLDQKWNFGFTIVSEMIVRICMALMPVAVGWVFSTQNYQLFYVIIGCYLAVFALSLVSMYNYCFSVANVMQSTMYSAVRFFLVVDPLFHSTRSSGQIIAKVNRGSEAFESFLDLVTFDIGGAIISIISVIVTMIVLNVSSGLWAAGFVIFIALFAVLNQIYMVQITAPMWIKDEDKMKAANVETLQQVAHIRSSFASNEQLQKVRTLVGKLQTTLATSWFSGIFLTLVIRTIFVISFLVVGTQIISSVQNGSLSSALGLSIIVAYLNSSSQIVNIGRSIERITDRSSRITDLFDFVSKFGKQTYPVLEEK